MMIMRKCIDRISRRVRGERIDGDSGFTLAELLVVVGIIGVLAAISVPMYLNQQEKAKDNAAKAEIRMAKTAVAAYVAEKALPTDGVKVSDLATEKTYTSPTNINPAGPMLTISYDGTTKVHTYVATIDGSGTPARTCTGTDTSSDISCS